MELRYTVSLKTTDEGVSVWVPGLPGCASQGRTEQEALENIRDAIQEYLAVVDELAQEGENPDGSGGDIGAEKPPDTIVRS